LCSFIKLSFPYFTHIPLNYKAINHSYGTSFRRIKRSMVALTCSFAIASKINFNM